MFSINIGFDLRDVAPDRETFIRNNKSDAASIDSSINENTYKLAIDPRRINEMFENYNIAEYVSQEVFY